MASTNAWEKWWQQATKNGQTHCLPFLDQSTKDSLLGFWGDFAKPLPKGASCIDLASGSGIVISMMLHHRPDLQCTGIDASPQVGIVSRDWENRPGVRMENLPFSDATFHAVTSQFGLEYGDRTAAIDEMVRVLKNGGHFGFIMHNEAGPVVAHNKKRADGLRWASQDEELIDKARRWLSLPIIMGSHNFAAFQNSVTNAIDQYGHGSGAHEFSLAVLQTLSLRGRQPDSEILAMLERLQIMVSGELVRLDALAKAALSKEAIDEFAEMLSDRCLEVNSVDTLPTGNLSGAIAWTLCGKKTG
jgi:SAM-dependent methyltransferase